MFAIIGLGNPDKKYEDTYHNIGFNAIDKFAIDNKFKFSKTKYFGKFAEGKIGKEKVVLLKPVTYMNLSGKAVKELVNKLKIPLTNILVICDDIDLPVGVLRLRKSGSGGTHNGMKNIVQELNSEYFPRLRIGIGKDMHLEVADFVLSKVKFMDNDILQKYAYPSASRIITKFIDNLGNVDVIDITKC